METNSELESEIKENGYFLLKDFFPKDTIIQIKGILDKANGEWKKHNSNPNTINSAYLTSTKFLPYEKERDQLFQFIASIPIIKICKTLFISDFYFLNTQIFFNPIDLNQRPYWHRDIQYMGISEEEQKSKILKDFVWHFRIPLEEDPGIWIVPGSHNRWDTEEERNIRLELGSHQNDEPIKNAILIPHQPGDLFVFSAHLLHKGEYGKNRFSFDILFTNFPESKDVVENWDHFPNWEFSSLTPSQRKMFITK
ncbi:phytanoyl-CoA dioxygenase family protein [Leptospira limi]|uniref:Phytanoyl-CoA dioxygenase family protein n=1 Tax=Leptospira limi TaxID=2950023 RepID=A0ABT3LUG5_9LEPT|nr:phytanoyl-CoA dioxygenase family protein [Leptospira limi]MCW7461381.1 phytanoyl-CoA dioxygenase family protein [Leptospira limi]